MVNTLQKRMALLTLAAAAAAVAWPNAARAFSLAYTYRLSTLTGVVRLSWAGLSADPEHRELYVVGGGLVHVFNEAGMEIHRFGDDEALGTLFAVAALEDGDLVALSYRQQAWKLLRLDFRGDPAGTFELRGVPAAFTTDFHPNSVIVRRDRVYVTDPTTMKVLVAGADGTVIASHDFSALAAPDDDAKDGDSARPDESHAAMMTGFGVDPQGNLLFTIAPKFKAYVVAPDGRIRSFGKPGGSPGKFGIVSGIAGDDAGRIYVVDTLKAAVIVFDREFRLVGEYGYSAAASDRLLGPREVAVSGGKVFVAQNGRRGVSVFTMRD